MSLSYLLLQRQFRYWHIDFNINRKYYRITNQGMPHYNQSNDIIIVS